MKYWILHRRQVRGPFAPEELARLPGFSGRDLVCHDLRKGNLAADWRPARTVPELAAVRGEDEKLYGAVRTALEELWQVIARPCRPSEAEAPQPPPEPEPAPPQQAPIGEALPQPEAPAVSLPPIQVLQEAPPAPQIAPPPAPVIAPLPVPVWQEVPPPPLLTPLPEIAMPPPAPQIAAPQVEPIVQTPLPAEPPAVVIAAAPSAAARPRAPRKRAALFAASASAAVLVSWLALRHHSSPKASEPVCPPCPSCPACPAPAAVASAAPAPAQALFEDLEIDAVKTVRAFPSADSDRSVGQLLDIQASRNNGLSFWTVERLDDDVFKVFFTVKPVSGKPATYEFEAKQSDKSVMGTNAAAQTLMP